MIILQQGKKYFENGYKTEDEFEKEIVEHSKSLFGKKTIYIETKNKIESKSLGGSIPDGFLFDLKDIRNPEFYIVEVELRSHDFYKHIFEQVTKFFAFFKNKSSHNELVEKIFSTVNGSDDLKNEFKGFLGDREIYKYIKDCLENSQNILLILDGNKNELPEIMETYADTWGKMVKVLILKKYLCEKESIFILDPDFENVEYPIEPPESEPRGLKIEYSEEFHLDGVDGTTKNIYFEIKKSLLKINRKLVFNPQKYYISVIHNKNIAYLQLRKKKIRLVVLLPEKEVRSKIKKNEVIHLSKGVQRFFNSSCCAIVIENIKNTGEVIRVIKPLIKKGSVLPQTS